MIPDYSNLPQAVDDLIFSIERDQVLQSEKAWEVENWLVKARGAKLQIQQCEAALNVLLPEVDRDRIMEAINGNIGRSELMT